MRGLSEISDEILLTGGATEPASKFRVTESENERVTQDFKNAGKDIADFVNRDDSSAEDDEENKDTVVDLSNRSVRSTLFD